MAVNKRCPHCLKKMKKLSETQYVCENHTPPIYVPPLASGNGEDQEATDE